MPVFNAGKYLNSTINSVLNQSYHNWELIAVDDASTDNSREILKVYTQNDSRIKVIYIESNSGVSNARNIGLDAVTGDYICWLDADDIYDSNFLKIMVDTALYYNCDIVECQYNTFSEIPNRLSDYSFDIELGNGNNLITRFGLNKLQTSLWSKIFKRDLFKNFHFPKGKIYEEPYFYFEKYTIIECVGYLNIALYNYRNTPNSIMKIISNNAVCSNIKIHNYIIDTINHVNIDKTTKTLVINRVINGATGFWKRILYSNTSNEHLKDMRTLLHKIDAIRLQNNIKIGFNSWCVFKFNRFMLFRLLLLSQFKLKQCLK